MVMRLHLRSALTLSKDSDPAALNEDNLGEDDQAQRYVVSDGAGESYAPSLWSRTLCDAWLTAARPATVNVLSQAIESYTRGCDIESMSWSQRGAFDRGSYATLLALQVRRNTVRILSIGDSLLLVRTRSGKLKSFPYNRAKQFDSRPVLVGTDMQANLAWLRRDVTSRIFDAYPLVKISQMLLMTDAVGKWALSQSDCHSAFTRLAKIATPDQFRDFVRAAQSEGTMRRDDATLIHLEAKRSK